MDDQGEINPAPPATLSPRKTALALCVERMKLLGLTGKARDDAAGHFLAGVLAAGLDVPVPPTGKYVDVLEALADA